MPRFDGGRMRFLATSFSWNPSKVNQTSWPTWSKKDQNADRHYSCRQNIKTSRLLPEYLRPIAVSWWNQRLIPNTPQTTRHHKCIMDAFFAYHSTLTIPTEGISNHINIAAEQSTGETLSRIIKALQTNETSNRSQWQQSSPSHETHPPILPGIRYLRVDD